MLHAKATKGYTLIELLIYVGLSLVVVTLFASVLITITRIQSQQNSSRIVINESNFVISTIKRSIQDATWLESHGNWMALTTPSSSPEAIIFDVSGGVVRMQPNSTSPFQSLTTSAVVTDSLSFTDYISGSNRIVKISLTLSRNTTNPQQAATQTVETYVHPTRTRF